MFFRSALGLCLLAYVVAIASFSAHANNKMVFPVVGPPVEGPNFTALAPGASTPPDTNGAVGPNHLLLATNGTVRIHDRTGTLLSSVSLAAFWSGLGVSDIFDPRSIFDPHNQRFIMITCAERRNAASSMLFAVSATDDPTGTWHQWQLDADAANTDWVDYGNLGFTANEITFSGNMFTIAADAFTGSTFWRINTASAMDGGALTMEQFFSGGVGGTVVPVATYDASETTQYMVRVGTANIFGVGRINVMRLGGSLGASSIIPSPASALGDAWSIALPDAPQLGSASLIETNDNRILSAVYQDGSLWACHTVALPAMAPDHTAAKWWEITPATGNAVQSGVLEDPSGLKFYYFPALTVNETGIMGLGCSGSAATEYVSTYYAWRNPGVPDGLLTGVQQYHAGVGSYSGPRWGDYSGVYLDPVDGQSIWVLQQYAETSNQWGIQWVQLTFDVVTGLPAYGNALLAGMLLALGLLGAFLLRHRFQGAP